MVVVAGDSVVVVVDSVVGTFSEVGELITGVLVAGSAVSWPRSCGPTMSPRMIRNTTNATGVPTTIHGHFRRFFAGGTDEVGSVMAGIVAATTRWWRLNQLAASVTARTSLSMTAVYRSVVATDA